MHLIPMMSECSYLHADSDATETSPGLVGGEQWPQPCCCSTVAKAWWWEMVLVVAAEAAHNPRQEVLCPLVQKQPPQVQARPFLGLFPEIQRRAVVHEAIVAAV